MGSLSIRETGTTPTYYTIFQGGDQTGADITYTLPASSANGVLTNTSGTLSWGAGSPFTDGSDITYLTDMDQEDFAIGSSAYATAEFGVDVENNTVRIGSGSTNNGILNMFASDGDTGSITYNTSDTWAFSGGNINLADDMLLILGTTGDLAMLNRSTTLAANTALTGVFVGTPVVGAIDVANSTIFSNITTDADIIFAVSDGGNSTELLRLDASASTVDIGTGATALTVDTNGNVGIGTGVPSGRMHAYISNAAVTAATYDGYFENLATTSTDVTINKYGAYITSTGAFTGGTGATNNYGLYVGTTSGGDNNYDIYAASGAYLSTGGTWTDAPSYRRYKGTYTETGSYLDKLMALDVYEWQYKDETIDGMNRYQADANRHAAPFLDDFYNTFHLGSMDGYRIQDLAGVTIASVKELNSRFIDQNEQVDLQLTTYDQQLTELNLKTDENITTLQGLQTSVDGQLAVAGENINDINSQIANYQLQITDLQSQIDELKQLNNLELNVAQIEANTSDIEYMKTLLGVSDTSTPGNITILGKLEAEGVVAGAFTVKVADVTKRTIGENYIKAVIEDENLDGLDDVTGDDGRTYVIQTTVVDAQSRIFVTPKSSIDQTIAVTEVVDGASFKVEIKNPVTEDLKFNWMIVREQ